MSASTSGPIGEMFTEPSALSVVTMPSRITWQPMFERMKAEGKRQKAEKAS